MKTIKQWLKECLSKEDYKKAEMYENRYWEEERDYFENALWGAFIWGNTREGYDYWRKIHDNEGSVQNNNTKQMKKIRQWLKEGLNKEDYWRAEQYENTVWEEEKSNFKRALFNAFIWMKTIEGEGYWEKIYNNEGSLQPDQTEECSDTRLAVDPKFIKRIHELSSPEVKQQLEQEFPSLILNLEEGVWYNYSGNLLCYKGEGKAYGFWNGKWGENWRLVDSGPENIKVATEEEVRDALIKEAKKRGYKAGNFICLWHKVVPKFVEDYDNWAFLVDSLYTEDLRCGVHVVYSGGKWAEVLSTVFTLEEAREFIAKIKGVTKEEITIENN